MYDNLKQKEGQGCKAREFNVSKGWFDNFGKRFGLKNVKITGEVASANQEAAKSPDAIKIIEEKGYLPEQVLMHIKVPYSGRESHKGHLLVKKRSEYQDLRQDRIG